MLDTSRTRMTRRDMRRETTKAAVLEAAREVFLEAGFEGATIKMIADRTGVSPGTVLNAEPSKAALLVAILHREYEQIAETVERMEAVLSGNASDRMRALLHLMLDGHTKHTELFAAAIGHSWLVSDPAYQAAIEEMDFAWEPLRRVMRDGVESGEFRSDLNVNGLLQVLLDIFFSAIREDRRENGRDAREALTVRLDVVMKGVEAPSAD